MLAITKVIEWDMGHRVPNHKNKCQNPHGHRYRLELTVFGQIDTNPGSSSEGMICDFGDIKTVMLKEVHDVLDHSFIVCESDEVMTHFFRTTGQGFNYLVVPFIPTAENMVRWCCERIGKALPAGLHIDSCRLYETPNSWADYRPQRS